MEFLRILPETPRETSRNAVANALDPVSKNRLNACLQRLNQEGGMATVEYAIGTLAAAALAGVLLFVIKDGSLTDIIRSLIQSAFKI